MFFAFLRALCPGQPFCCQFGVLALVCHDGAGSADTDRALLTVLEDRNRCDVVLALHLRHIVDEAAHKPHCLREGCDLSFRDILVAGFQIDMAVCGNHRDTILEPLLLHRQHLLDRVEFDVDFSVRTAGPVFSILSHCNPHPVCSACINGGKINFSV